MSEPKPKYAKKLLLLHQIQQRRQELGVQNCRWQLATAPWDRRWMRLLSFRRYLIAGTSLLALYNVRHPSRLIRGAYPIETLAVYCAGRHKPRENHEKIK